MNTNNRFLQGIIFVVLLIALKQGVQWINSSKSKYPTSLDTFANKIASKGYQPVPLPAGLDENTKVITILLFGRTKAGKSSLGNKVSGRDIFEVGNHLESNTTQTKDHITLLGGKYYIRIIDTPGFADNRVDRTNEEVLQDIISFVANLQNGINIGIYCIPAGSGISMHDIEEMNHIGILLGKNVFKHTLIAVTKADTLEPSLRETIYQQYPKELPNIFENHGIFNFESDKVLFADFDKFESNFIPPFLKLIADSSTYHPEISKDLNISDTESIKMVLATPQIQEIMKKNEIAMEEQRRAAEEAKKLVEGRLQQAEENIKKNEKEQEIFKSKIEDATKKLEEEHSLNKELRKEYTTFKTEQENKLASAMNENQKLVSQSKSLSNILQDRESQINNLKDKVEELQKLKLSIPDLTSLKILGAVSFILLILSLGIAAYKSPGVAFMILCLIASMALFIWVCYSQVKALLDQMF